MLDFKAVCSVPNLSYLWNSYLKIIHIKLGSQAELRPGDHGLAGRAEEEQVTQLNMMIINIMIMIMIVIYEQ